MPQDRQMKLGAFLMTDGHHVAAWRHPKVRPDASVSLDHFLNLAKRAEAAKFDALFLADSNGVRERGLQALSHNSRAASFEPLTLLSALATVTERIGLNLDKHYARADRYARAREFVAVTTGLWNTWEDDAFLRDQDSGLFFDPQKHHVLDHRGRYFKVRGPLNVPRSPQGHPVIVQAGSSAAGVDLAAETAEAVFTAQQTLADAQAFYADLKGRAETYGRDPDHIKIMPGIFPVVGRTEAEAQETFEALQARIHPVVGLALLSSTLGGFDLTGYPLDGPLPELPETNGPKSRQKLLIDLARRENLTIRELYLQIAGARGHWQLVGTAEQIVDRLEERFRKGGADGFNVMAPFLPGGLEDFIALVIPELRRRGLFRTDYEGRTLRENLGLPFPAHRARTAAPLQAAE
ncbi:LLM class flavin-dependent oxidoreductase [Methylobacterium sp. E-066]|uniref:LLM class flavin-dependent oxidoreductase n=1 Tax=Methylobacterium sp. E-066 TaxID=2836584 RepID=UPI001FBB5E08|nr:LLM class flavin-dependent oxidoreductase [Methylobacterium sp. E-066]MCJ2144421.1 LLM class flavin-dependent oxidoreductase [Methylobacterium sp. E-066]